MRVTSPAVTVKTIWDALVAEYGAADTYGLLLETNLDEKVSVVDAVVDAIKTKVDLNLDAKVSEAKADVSALATAAALTAAKAVIDAIVIDTAGIGGAAMRGTDSAALASAWTAGLATILGHLSQARIEALDDVGYSSSMTPSDVLLLSSDGVVTHTGDTDDTKKKEFVVTVAGNYRVTFEIKLSEDELRAEGRVYRNGEVHGTERYTSGDHTVYQAFTEDLFFGIGDLVQLYISTYDAQYTVSAQNFRLKGDLGKSVGSEVSV